MDGKEEKYIPPLVGETANNFGNVCNRSFGVFCGFVLRFYFHQFEVHWIILCLKELSYGIIILGLVFISQIALVVKNPPLSAGDVRDAGSIPGLGRSSGGGHDNPFLYSWLESLMDRGVWWATVHRVAKSWTQLSNLAHFHIWIIPGSYLRCLNALTLTQILLHGSHVLYTEFMQIRP